VAIMINIYLNITDFALHFLPFGNWPFKAHISTTCSRLHTYAEGEGGNGRVFL
jgi:hypothetical protein